MGHAGKILVVDDDPAVRGRFEQDLSGKGYGVVTATTGEDALWQLSHDRYDLILTGIVLRGMSGLEVAEEIHTRYQGLPVIIITRDSTTAAQERATAAGVAEFLHKPLSSEQLTDTVDRVLKAAELMASSRPQTPAAETGAAQATNPFVLKLKNIFLFLLGPFISLFYLLTFPVIGLGMLVYMAFKAKEQKPEKAELLHPAPLEKSSVVKSIAKMLVMVTGGIVYAVFVPILGIGLVLWFGLQAWGKLGAHAMGTSQT